MDTALLANILEEELATRLPAVASLEALRLALAQWVEEKLQHDFEGLIRLLYRVDVDEEKLKFFLREKTGEDASQIIADLIIERQVRKWEFRQQFRQEPPPPDDPESW